MSAKRLVTTLFFRLSLAFLGSIIVLGLLQTLIVYDHFSRYSRESLQRAQWTLASQLGTMLQPVLLPAPDRELLGLRFYELSQSYPSADVYLIDGSGVVRHSLLSAGQLQLDRIDISAVRRFIDGGVSAPLPILGDDPRDTERQKPISAAPIRIGDTHGYIYVILEGRRADLINQSLTSRYGLQTLSLGLITAFLASVATGVALFFVLTRRLRDLRRSVERFRQGDYSARVVERGNDDLQEIASTFNRMAETVQSAIDAQRRTDEERRRFVASISHDLHSPLTYIRGNIETLLIEGATESTQQRLEQALRGIDSLSALIDTLFELSKLEAREARPTIESIPMIELLEHVVAQKQSLADSKGVRVAYAISEGCFVALADPRMLERVLINLLDNAIKYSPQHGVVEVALSHEDSSLTVAIRDCGLGISSEDVPRLGTPFYRVEASKTYAPGSGLGLALVRRLLEAQSSKLQIESVAEKGSCFSFTLPISPQ